MNPNLSDTRSLSSEVGNCLPTDMTEVPAWLRARCDEHASVYDIAVYGRPDTWLAITEVLSCASIADDDDAYELGKRDGYESAVQDIDLLTGGDGEYRYCTDHDPDRHCPDPETMKQRIVERLEAPSRAQSTGAGVRSSFWVVERFEDGKSAGYWDGGNSRTFVPEIEKAIQFCRRQDALWVIVGWHWKDVKITEHVMLGAAPATPAGDDVERLSTLTPLYVKRWRSIIMVPAGIKDEVHAVLAAPTMDVERAIAKAIQAASEDHINHGVTWLCALDLARAALAAMPARRECIEDVPCRFGCKAATGIYYIPKGCSCWNDPVQALCEQHAIKAQSEGPITLIAHARSNDRGK